MALHVNLDNLKIGDLELMERAGSGGAGMSEMIDVLDRALDEDVRDMPLTQLTDIIQAVNEAVGNLGNPEVNGKN